MKLHQTEAGITIDLIAGEIPGSIVRDGALYFPVSGQYFRVSAVRISKKYGIIPILDMNITDTPKGGQQHDSHGNRPRIYGPAHE